MSRKIIQIAVDSQPEDNLFNAWVSVTALCDDGSVWECVKNPDDRDWKWLESLPDVPQDRDK